MHINERLCSFTFGAAAHPDSVNSVVNRMPFAPVTVLFAAFAPHILPTRFEMRTSTQIGLCCFLEL